MKNEKKIKFRIEKLSDELVREHKGYNSTILRNRIKELNWVLSNDKKVKV